ncbi:epoxide hydrolase family protein [Enterovirga rhinocerotis]|uniref:Microsomal epoxide hydrolase n=1 Tax=Enterovirga rhinocerotis TaxID=1339210 RepID=A0A4R7C7K5_9HYPH|nr:epoxide hydrolase family protein [Enterovirga rhinocerotis]TDR94620.1 microsomal epoxide hydrolase [Enterovirga rhinocerotis]
MAEPRPFSLHVSDEALADLRQRLALTRLPDQTPGEPWAYGTEVGYMSELVRYWRDAFDWRREEAWLNAFPQFKVQLDDVDVHCLYVEGKGPNPRPLLLCHGWPGSVFEFLNFIPRLTDPARFGLDPSLSFTVVAPSLPGYGLSFAPGQKRFSVEEIADRLVEVMAAFGYGRFLVQGGDWGGFTAARMAYAHPDNVEGIHLNIMPLPRDGKTNQGSTPEEKAHFDHLGAWLKDGTGYQWIQGTKPQTLAFALTDSPAGLAAWIVEKFRSWSDCEGVIENAIPRDHMLANIALYWFTGAIGSSFWPYYTRMHSEWPVPPGGKVMRPTAYAEFPKEMVRPPRSLAEEMFADIRRWTVMPKGGHFAALEQPDLLVEDVRAFVSAL